MLKQGKPEEHIAFRIDLIPEYLRDLPRYQAGKPVEEIAREKGLTRISKLASNENPLGPSPFAMKKMTMGLWNIHRYPDMHAFSLKLKLCELYNLNPENIILGNGSEGIISYISRAFLQPGDEVVTSEKTFIGFMILARASGANIIETPMTNDWRFNVKALAKKVSKKTKVVYIANPNNPSGTYITRPEFDELMASIPPQTLVILDEAYYEFARSVVDYPDSMKYRYDNVITLRTFSKAYGLSGIRLGYGFGHEKLIENLEKVKLPFEPNSIAQLGGEGALTDQPHLQRTLNNNRKRYEKTWSFLHSRGFAPIPSIANFITFKTGSEIASRWIFERLLEDGVIIRLLHANQMDDYVRVSLGTKEQMAHFYESFDRILSAFDQHFERPE